MPANNLIKRFVFFFLFWFLGLFFICSLAAFFWRLAHSVCAHITHTHTLRLLRPCLRASALFLRLSLPSRCLCNFHFVKHVDISLISCYMHPTHTHTHSATYTASLGAQHSLIFISLHVCLFDFISF